MALRFGAAAPALAAALLAAAPARAEEPPKELPRGRPAPQPKERPHTLAEIDVGMLALPAASICTTSFVDCITGEASIALGIRSFYRWNRFALGAGIHYASSLRTDPAPGPPEIERQHERSYFYVEGEFRFYPWRSRSLDFWFGGTGGVVVVNDSWSTLGDREPYSDADFIGPRALTIATVGGAAGLAAGLDWSFTERWSLGPMVRTGMWFFPEVRNITPTGDSASLAGRVDVLQLSVTLSYRIPL